MRRPAWVRLGFLVSALLIGKPSGGVAQEAPSFDQLRMLVKKDDTVSVIDRSGKTTKGKVVQISGSSLQLASAGLLRDLAKADIVEIRQRRRDSLGNGATIGAGVGLGVGAFAGVGQFLLTGDCVGCAIAITGIFTGIGAGIGVGIDAIIVRERRIYFSRAISSSRLTVRPLLSADRKGISISWSF